MSGQENIQVTDEIATVGYDGVVNINTNRHSFRTVCRIGPRMSGFGGGRCFVRKGGKTTRSVRPTWKKR